MVSVMRLQFLPIFLGQFTLLICYLGIQYQIDDGCKVNTEDIDIIHIYLKFSIQNLFKQCGERLTHHYFWLSETLCKVDLRNSKIS